MSKFLHLLLFILISISGFCQQNVTQRFIVKLKKDNTIDNQKLQLLLQKNKSSNISSPFVENKNINQSLKSTELVNKLYFVEFDSLKADNLLMKELMDSDLFEFVEKDGIGNGGGVEVVTPDDTYFNRQWGFNNNGTFNAQATVGADVDIVEAWEKTTGNANTIVCVLDGGLKLDHPEFAGRLWTNALEIANNGVDDDNNGYIDDVNGWDWAYADKDPSDDYGHGTNVTGIIAANANNTAGYAGVNWNCKIMVGKILNNANSGFYSWWISGIYYAVANGAKVINMSVGGSGFSQAMKDACDFAYNNNVTILACMMNTNNNVTYYPAGYASTIAVGSTNPNDYRSSPFPWSATSGSNYGAHIDIVAPGNFIYGLYHLSNTYYDSYWSGTSQATPLVAGVVSLMYGLKPTLTVSTVRDILTNTAIDGVGNPVEDIVGFDNYMGYGRMNAFAALSSSLLPLKMGILSGNFIEKEVHLDWTTYYEENIKEFIVEYSKDIFTWNKIGIVKSKGNNLNTQAYAFKKATELSGVIYYRLKIIENDGTYT